MTRFIVILSVLAALIGLAVVEQVCIHNTYDKMKADTAALIMAVNETPDETPFDDYTRARANDLYEYWLKKERSMSVLIRHIDLSYISDALIYARNFIRFDNKEEASAGLARLDYLLDTYSHVYSLNGLNIF
jgi:molybdopterin-guanine dinucleotide biosynthesis protein A